jgi:hypothetical protein
VGSRKFASSILLSPGPRGARLAREGLVVRGETGDQTDQESRSAGTEPQVDFSCWTDQNRRMSKDYERLPESSEAFIYAAMSRLMARRLARS